MELVRLGPVFPEICTMVPIRFSRSISIVGQPVLSALHFHCASDRFLQPPRETGEIYFKTKKVDDDSYR